MKRDSVSFFGSRVAAITVAALSVALTVGVAFAVGLWVAGHPSGKENQPPSASSDSIFRTCLDKAHEATKMIPPDQTQQSTYDEIMLNTCYGQVRAQLILREFELRGQALSATQREGLRINLLSMIILLFATTSGILLSGLQMLVSFRLMLRGYQQIESNTELVLKYNAVALRSSAVGVTIFTVSMLFFAFFIYFNYQISAVPSSMEELSVVPRPSPAGVGAGGSRASVPRSSRPIRRE
jgi:hypothetical protein